MSHIIYPDIDCLVNDKNNSSTSGGWNPKVTAPLEYDSNENILYLDQIGAISNDNTLSANSDSILSTQKAVKTYIDGLVSLNIVWVDPVVDFYDASVSLPSQPITGERHICSVAGHGWLLNRIYTYNGTTWTSSITQEGTTAYMLSNNNIYSYDGVSAWIMINSAFSNSTQDSTSTSTGALVVSGGLGVGKSIYADKVISRNIEHSVLEFIPLGTNTTTTDCSTYFNNALAAYDNIRVPAGTYLINTSVIIANNKSIHGDGSNNTIINTTTTNNIVVFVINKNNTISDLKFTNTNISNNIAIGNTNNGASFYSNIFNVYISNFAYGIRLRYTLFCSLKNIIIMGCKIGIKSSRNAYDPFGSQRNDLPATNYDYLSNCNSLSDISINGLHVGEIGIFGVFHSTTFNNICCEIFDNDGSANIIAPSGLVGTGIYLQNGRPSWSSTGPGCTSSNDHFFNTDNTISTYYCEQSQCTLRLEGAGLKINGIFAYGSPTSSPTYYCRFYLDHSVLILSDSIFTSDQYFNYNVIADTSTITGLDGQYLGPAVITSLTLTNCLYASSIKSSICSNNYGTLNVYNTNNSTSSTTGALVVNGGLGIASDEFIGGKLRVLDTSNSTSLTSGSVVLSGGLGVSGNSNIGTLVINDTSNTTSTSTGSLILKGGAYIAKDLTIGTSGGLQTLTVDHTIFRYGLYTATSQSTDIYSGAFAVAGGVGISKNLNVGGNENITGTFAVSGASTFNNTTDSTDTLTGSVVVNGGMAVKKNLNVNNQIQCNGFGNVGNALFMQGDIIQYMTDNATDTQSGSIQTRGGCSISKNLYVGSDLHVSGNIIGNTSPPSYGTNDSTSTDTGAFVLTGGMGLGKNLNVGGILTNWNTSDSTDIYSGSMHLVGGASIEKKLYCFRLNVGENSVLTGNTNVKGLLYASNTVDSTSTDTGGLLVYGGAAVNKNITVGGSINVKSNTVSSSISTGSIVASGGVGIAGDLFVGGLMRSNTISLYSGGTGSVTNYIMSPNQFGGDFHTELMIGCGTSANSSAEFGFSNYGGNVSPSNYAYMNTTGGNRLCVYNDHVVITSTKDSTSYSTGALLCNGGIGIVGDSFFNNSVVIDGTLTCNDVITGIVQSKHLYYYLSGDITVTSGTSGYDIPFSQNTAIDNMTGYDTSTHVFTPPYNGFYMLQVNMQIKEMNQGTYLQIQFSKNNNLSQDSMTGACTQPIYNQNYPNTYVHHAYLTTDSTMKFKLFTNDTLIKFWSNSCLSIIFMG